MIFDYKSFDHHTGSITQFNIEKSLHIVKQAFSF